MYAVKKKWLLDAASFIFKLRLDLKAQEQQHFCIKIIRRSNKSIKTEKMCANFTKIMIQLVWKIQYNKFVDK